MITLSETWMDEYLALFDCRPSEIEAEEDLVVAHLLEFFKGDFDKVELWLSTKNPLLGGVSPWVMLCVRPGKLLGFVETQLSENAPPETP